MSDLALKAIFAAVLVTAALVWWERHNAALVDQGRAEQRAADEQANTAAKAQRQREIAGYVVDTSKRETDLRARLAAAESRINLQTQDRDHAPKKNVTPRANAQCVVTRGLVRELDASLPGPAGRPDIPSGLGDVDEPAGIPLDRVAAITRHNFAECSKAVERLRAENERRFDACIAWDKRFGTQSDCARGSP